MLYLELMGARDLPHSSEATCAEVPTAQRKNASCKHYLISFLFL